MNAQLEDYSVPEIRRVSLEDVCLQVILLDLAFVDMLTSFLVFVSRFGKPRRVLGHMHRAALAGSGHLYPLGCFVTYFR